MAHAGARAIRGAVSIPSDDPALGLAQVLDERGTAEPDRVPQLSVEEFRHLYRFMLLARTADERFLHLQRQGRIGFYAESKGHEAAIFGSAATLRPSDWTMPALREAWVAMYRGLPLRTYVAQLYGNANDPAMGHQMPCHAGTRASHHVTMSSCIATQLPHAVGMAWAARIKREDTVILGYLGDGATSESDFHVALNFAGVFRAPVVFVCQNNQWAISVPIEAQTASPTLAIKAHAYGIPAMRVDGNDVFAVYEAVKSAVDHARAGGGPTFVECVTYRVSAHTSSDDPSRYRDERITEQWKKKDPITRYRTWLFSQGLLNDELEGQMKRDIEREIKEAIADEESAPPPPLRSLVESVFAEVPAFLEAELGEIEDLPRQKPGGVQQ